MVSQYAMEYLRHKFVAALMTRPTERLELSVSMRWQDRVGCYTTFEGEVKDYRPFALVDARAAWQASHVKLYAEMNNVLNNRSYVDFGNVPQPGAWFIAGLTWHL